MRAAEAKPVMKNNAGAHMANVKRLMEHRRDIISYLLELHRSEKRPHENNRKIRLKAWGAERRSIEENPESATQPLSC